MNGGVFEFNNPTDKFWLAEEELSSDERKKILAKLESNTNCEIVLIGDYNHANINQQGCQCKEDN